MTNDNMLLAPQDCAWDLAAARRMKKKLGIKLLF